MVAQQALADRPENAVQPVAAAGARAEEAPPPQEREKGGERPEKRQPGHEGGEKRDGASFSGILKNADAAKLTLTLTIRRDGGVNEERMFNVAKEVKIFIPRKEAVALGDLKQGMAVTVTLSADRKQVVVIRAGGREGKEGDKGKERPALRGVIEGVDGAKTIRLKVGREGNFEAKTLALARDVQVTSDLGREVKLADLKEGVRATLTLSEDRKVVVRIVAQAPTDRGAVKSVDAAQHTITLTGDGGDRTFKVEKGAQVLLNGKQSKLADVTAGMRVTLTLMFDRSAVVRVVTGRGDKEGGEESPLVD
jgi:hypothetical protein